MKKKNHGLSLGEKQRSMLLTFDVVAREDQPKGVHLDTLLSVVVIQFFKISLAKSSRF